MRFKRLIVSWVASFSFCTLLNAQEKFDDNFKGQPFRSAVNQTWYWLNDDYVYEGEHIWTVLMPEYVCYANPITFKNEKERKKYNRLVYNVRRVLPLAQEVNQLIRETYVVLEKLPTEEAKQKHIKRVEKEIMTKYKPEMKKLTYSQGKLMIKLVERQCKQSGYEVVKAFLGPTRAAFYQMFAWTFNASLKKKYDAEGDDRLIERICVELEQGTL